MSEPSERIILPALNCRKNSVKVTPLGKFLRALRIEHDVILRDMAKSLGYSSSLLSGIELGTKSIPEKVRFLALINRAYSITDGDELVRLVEGHKLNSESEKDEERPLVDMKALLDERVASGSPIIVLDPGHSSQELLEAINKLLPDDGKAKLFLFDPSTHGEKVKLS
ncbi:TPA: helix-turn-helix domain-containing protein [Vibrio parahaemolyticus]|nr:helix-turn-helix domain-containing protein [Vibrio parahaemolyticus]HBC3917016.1 helix-turn-helix domain-containing protein [Vibrio parahaemolyticus]